MKRLLIIGAGNVGGFLSYNIDLFGNYDVLGFLDDASEKQGKEFYGRKVVGRIDDIKRFHADGNLCVVIGISSPSAKRQIAERLSGLPLNFPNFVSQDVWLSKEVQLGNGIILYPGTKINYETIVGDFVIMNMNCSIGHNCSIGNYSSLSPGVNLAGFTIVEEMVSIGIGACTRQGIRLGKLSAIGGQSMLVRNVDPNTVVAGVPAENLVVSKKKL